MNKVERNIKYREKFNCAYDSIMKHNKSWINKIVKKIIEQEAEYNKEMKEIQDRINYFQYDF